jgi:hypothetical protein
MTIYADTYPDSECHTAPTKHFRKHSIWSEVAGARESSSLANRPTGISGALHDRYRARQIVTRVTVPIAAWLEAA